MYFLTNCHLLWREIREKIAYFMLKVFSLLVITVESYLANPSFFWWLRNWLEFIFLQPLIEMRLRDWSTWLQNISWKLSFLFRFNWYCLKSQQITKLWIMGESDVVITEFFWSDNLILPAFKFEKTVWFYVTGLS